MSKEKSPNKQRAEDYANKLMKRPQVEDAFGGGAVKSVDEEDFATILENFNLNGQVVQLQAKQKVEGILIGPGTPLTMNRVNPETGREEEVPIDTWEFDVGGGVRVKIMSAHQLAQELPPLIGKHVVVVRGPDINVKNGRRVTRYIVGTAKGGADE